MVLLFSTLTPAYTFLSQVTPNCRVALRNDSYTLHKILPNKVILLPTHSCYQLLRLMLLLFIFSYSQVDPLVSLMMVEKVPDSTYEMVGGLDKQIKEIKEVG